MQTSSNKKELLNFPRTPFHHKWPQKYFGKKKTKKKTFQLALTTNYPLHENMEIKKKQTGTINWK